MVVQVDQMDTLEMAAVEQEQQVVQELQVGLLLLEELEVQEFQQV
tara:strand:- start:193 stop:327 length:135 start_codon:yes stop_codon:yes gene_type:complete